MPRGYGGPKYQQFASVEEEIMQETDPTGSHSITATSEPAADDHLLTIGALTHPNGMTILEILASLYMNDFALANGAEVLYLRIYVDIVDTNHRLVDLELRNTQPGDTVGDAANSACKVALLTPGSHDLKVRMWVNAGDCTVDFAVMVTVGTDGVGVDPFEGISVLSIDANIGLASIGLNMSNGDALAKLSDAVVGGNLYLDCFSANVGGPARYFSYATPGPIYLRFFNDALDWITNLVGFCQTS
jgi:hypothetical protein